MKQESQNWLDRAKEDLTGAQFNCDGDKTDIAAFLCQQAAEKALKAFLIQQAGRFPRSMILRCSHGQPTLR